MIPFNVPPITGAELAYLRQAMDEHRKLSGDGPFTAKCHQWFEQSYATSKCLLTTSCTHALEMAALLCNIQPGDEVIAPSYTFVSTVNAFVLRGAKVVFVDIRPDTMNLDETLVEDAITDKTKAIIPVHYAGVACEMDAIMNIAKRNQLMVVEDAAQAMMANYKGRRLGTIGDAGCFSFHETKNYSMGEGGAILIQRPEWCERAEIIREKGTNRSRFLRGQVDKYTWVDVGSSYLPSELNAAFLYAQLQHADAINHDRLASWQLYYEGLQPLADSGQIGLPHVPVGCEHNAHMFYLKCRDVEERSRLIEYLKNDNISAVFHYVPLHSTGPGYQFGRFHGEDRFTTRESERLLRLPLYYRLQTHQIEQVIERVNRFYR